LKERLLSEASKALNELMKEFNDVAIKLTSRDAVMVKLWNSEPSVVQSWREHTAVIYLSKDKRVFELGINLSKIEDVIKVAKRVKDYVGMMKESELYAPLPEPSRSGIDDVLVDSTVIKYMEDPLEPTNVMIEEAFREGAERVAGTLHLEVSKYALVTSKGFEGYKEGSEVMAYLRAFKGEDSGHWAYGSRYLRIEELKRVGKLAGRYASECSGKVTDIEPGRYDVVLSPLVLGNLMSYVGMMASALYVMMGFSIFMRRKPGEKIASEVLTLIDKPKDTELAGSAEFDDEGIETFDKEIIGKGIFKNLLHNSKTAGKLGVKSTGNAGWVMPRPWNLEVVKGDYGLDELIKEVKKGLLITNNWYTRLQNYVEGSFSSVTRDALFLVENGELRARVRRVRISDTFPNLLSNVQALGKDQYLIKWWEVEVPSRLPYALVRNVGITKPFA